MFAAPWRVEACSSTEVLQEMLCPVILPVSLADTDRARDLLGAEPAVSARHAIHAAVMLNNHVRVIATFDAGFDAIEDIERMRLT